MRSPTTTAALAALVLTVPLAATACSDGEAGPGSSSSSGPKAEYDTAMKQVVNPSDTKGGTLTFGHTDDVDSTDPGDMYYAHAWNFSRLYARTLLTFKMKPGAEPELVPDLATGLGKPTDGGRTWTYTLKEGVRFEDGSAVRAEDVKYAIARSNWGAPTIKNGPTYFRGLLKDDGYKGPYQDKDLGHFTGVTTPDDHTVVFHLKQPFAEFDFLATIPQTAPVPQAKDTGAEYYKHPLSTGPYKFDGWERGKQGALSRNTSWDAAGDPNRKQLPDTIKVLLKLGGPELDNRLLAGTVDVAMEGTGLLAAARTKVLRDPELKVNSDNPLTGFGRYMGINVKVPPFDNVHCRLAVQYATDRDAIFRARGGEIGGEISTTMLPKGFDGYQAFDLYPNGPDNHGDLAKARQELAACGQPNGFEAKMIYRSNRDEEKATAVATEQALARVGIKLSLKGYISSAYTGEFAGSPNFLHSNKVALMAYGWGPDFSSGYGYLQQIVDGRAIKPAGNSNIAELNDPAVNALIDKSVVTLDKGARSKIYNEIDRKVMETAAYVPWVYDKQLSYRSPKVTNWWFDGGYLMYDFATLGKTDGK